MKPTTLLLFIHLLFIPFAKAQTDTVVTLEQELDKATTKPEKSKLFQRLVVRSLTKGDSKAGITWARTGLTWALQTKDSTALGQAYGVLGAALSASQKDSAMIYFVKAERLLENDSINLLSVLVNKGNLFYYEHDFLHARQYYETVIQLAPRGKDSTDVTSAVMNIGNIYFEKYSCDTALIYYFKALRTVPRNGDSSVYQMLFMDIGNSYVSMEKNKEGKIYIEKALSLSLKLKHVSILPLMYYNLAGVEFNLHQIKAARQHLWNSMETGQRAHNYRNLTFCLRLGARVDSALGRMDSAYADLNYLVNLTDSLHNSELLKSMAETQTKYDLEKKNSEIGFLNRDKALQSETLRRQKMVTILVLVALVIFGILSVFLFRNISARKRAHGLLSRQKKEIEVQKERVEEHRKEIIDSITYAKRLQQAILPSLAELHKHVPDSFLFYQPKDIVAGDFYWMENLDDTLYIAAADCTGHGVPGAMVSIVCSNALNRAVKEFGLRDTGQILNKTRDLVLETFSKSNDDVKDGMDISLLSVNRTSGKINWSGANNPLWYIENGILRELKPNKQAIGSTYDPAPFNTHPILISSTVTFYLLTDGFADQFGGLKGKKFKYQQLKDLLLANCAKNLDEQKEVLLNTFNAWKGNLEQVDDVTIVGIKLTL